MRRRLVVALLGGIGAVLAVDAGCSSFGSGADPAPPADASADAVPVDGSQGDASATDAGSPLGAKYCDGKKFTVCSDFEPPIAFGKPGIDVGWTSVERGNDLAVDLNPASPMGSRGQGLRVKVPFLPDAGQAGQALQAQRQVPSELVFAATMQMAPVNSVTQYTEILRLDLPDDPSQLQVVVAMIDENLTVSENVRVDGGTNEAPILPIGQLSASDPLRVEVHLWFSDAKNEVAVVVDNGKKLARRTLNTLPSGKPVGTILFSAGYVFSTGTPGRNGGSYYLDDVTLDTKP